MNNHTPSAFDSNDASEGRKRTTMFDTPGVKTKQFRTEEDMTSPATACTEVRSPESATECVHDAEASSADEESKEQAAYWKNLVEGDGTATREAPNLVSFLTAKQKREIATEQFSMALDECMSGLAGSVEETLQDSVVPYHEEKRVRIESLDDDIVATMKENHKKRTSMRERLETANMAWTKMYGHLMAEVLGKEPTEAPGTYSSAVDGVSGVVRHVKDEEQGKDPDWDKLSEFPPLAESIRCFLTARDRVQAAEEALSLALDEIHEGLKTNAEEMVQIGADFHNQHEANYSALEEDIQFHLMSNNKRGCEYEERVEETKRHMQGMFASLLARVCRGRT